MFVSGGSDSEVFKFASTLWNLYTNNSEGTYIDIITSISIHYCILILYLLPYLIYFTLRIGYTME